MFPNILSISLLNVFHKNLFPQAQNKNLLNMYNQENTAHADYVAMP